jgi:hypothetical protein
VIPKITTGTGGTYGLITYLYGPGKANEHTDQHMVTSWNGFAPDPGPTAGREAVTKLARQLDLPVKSLPRDQRPKTTIWHCSVRTASDDRPLTDDEWAAVARRIVHAAGIAPEGDTKACRWVAVRHAPDHIHIAATLVREDRSFSTASPHRAYGSPSAWPPPATSPASPSPSPATATATESRSGSPAPNSPPICPCPASAGAWPPPATPSPRGSRARPTRAAPEPRPPRTPSTRWTRTTTEPQQANSSA